MLGVTTAARDKIDRVLGSVREALAVTSTNDATEPLSASEIRVLRYLSTNLTRPEIASELYAKLGAHSRREAVDSARALGLLAPSARPR